MREAAGGREGGILTLGAGGRGGSGCHGNILSAGLPNMVNKTPPLRDAIIPEKKKIYDH